MRKFLVAFAVTDTHSTSSSYGDRCTVYDSFTSTEIMTIELILEDGEKANEETFMDKVKTMRDEAKMILDEYVNNVKYVRHNDGIYDEKVDTVRKYEKFVKSRVIAWSLIEE